MCIAVASFSTLLLIFVTNMDVLVEKNPINRHSIA